MKGGQQSVRFCSAVFLRAVFSIVPCTAVLRQTADGSHVRAVRLNRIFHLPEQTGQPLHVSNQNSYEASLFECTTNVPLKRSRISLKSTPPFEEVIFMDYRNHIIEIINPGVQYSPV